MGFLALLRSPANTRIHVESLQKFVILAVVAPAFWSATVFGGTNFDTCLADVKNGLYGIGPDIGGTDNHGRPVNTSDATGITYGLCLRACGGAQEPFSWIGFSQQFGSWLLPWLALISQLPFGANDKADNLESVLLTLGSPALAAYSLGLTVLNGRWIVRRFSDCKYPNVRHAVRILSSLQQAPLKIETKGPLLASLIVLPENDKWWSELEDWINYTHTWSISAVTTIAWVVIAYIFTVIDSFGDITTFINSNGTAVGSLWLWLLPIVIGWLQISPKCDSERLSSAIERGKEIAYVATDEGRPILVKDAKTDAQALELTLNKKDFLRQDERCTAPIFNYARLFSWVDTVEKVSAAFKTASDNCHDHKSVDGSNWVTAEHRNKLDNSNRVGNATQVIYYCLPSLRDRSCLEPEVLSRIFVASIFALMLQWSTVGAATLIAWVTPTRGK